MSDDWKLTYEGVEPHGLCCAECKGLRAERDRLREKLAEAKQAIKTIIKEDGVVVSRQAARVTELETALRQYGEHKAGCELAETGSGDCTCGLDRIGL